MRLSESHRLPVPLLDAWDALNDVATLRRALPGCESLLEVAPDGPGAATLRADIVVDIEGVIGVLGAPLIELAAHEMARQFFEGLRALAPQASRRRA